MPRIFLKMHKFSSTNESINHDKPWDGIGNLKAANLIATNTRLDILYTVKEIPVIFRIRVTVVCTKRFLETSLPNPWQFCKVVPPRSIHMLFDPMV